MGKKITYGEIYANPTIKGLEEIIINSEIFNILDSKSLWTRKIIESCFDKDIWGNFEIKCDMKKKYTNYMIISCEKL